jgi:hypothetical protein
VTDGVAAVETICIAEAPIAIVATFAAVAIGYSGSSAGLCPWVDQHAAAHTTGSWRIGDAAANDPKDRNPDDRHDRPRNDHREQRREVA